MEAWTSDGFFLLLFVRLFDWLFGLVGLVVYRVVFYFGFSRLLCSTACFSCLLLMFLGCLLFDGFLMCLLQWVTK